MTLLPYIQPTNPTSRVPPNVLFFFPTLALPPGPSLVGSTLDAATVDTTRHDTDRQFYFNRDWDSVWHGGVCSGAARPLKYRPGGWEEFHHWQANAGVGALMEYQVWKLVRPH